MLASDGKTESKGKLAVEVLILNSTELSKYDAGSLETKRAAQASSSLGLASLKAV